MVHRWFTSISNRHKPMWYKAFDELRCFFVNGSVNGSYLKGGESMTFKSWILQFINEDSPRGDLAIDVRDDAPFPNSKTYKKNCDYLNYAGASRLCMESFENAFNQYKQEMSK